MREGVSGFPLNHADQRTDMNRAADTGHRLKLGVFGLQAVEFEKVKAELGVLLLQLLVLLSEGTDRREEFSAGREGVNSPLRHRFRGTDHIGCDALSECFQGLHLSVDQHENDGKAGKDGQPHSRGKALSEEGRRAVIHGKCN